MKIDIKKFLKKSELGEEDFTAMQKENQLKVSNWQKSDGKYIAAVSDGNLTLDDNTKYKYLASYIKQKDNIIGVKLQRFLKDSNGNLMSSPLEFNLPFKQANKLSDFLKFLNDADLGSLTSGNFHLVDELKLDPELYSKLVTLSSDPKGKISLLKLVKDGYLELDLDIADLIRKGLSSSKIEEHLKALNEFEGLINKSELKEVADVQKYLKKIPWIFGPEYISLDVRDAGEEGVPDGRLKRVDGLSDILEIKLPSIKLLQQDIKKPARQYMYSDLSKALGQLTGYLEYYDSEYSTERDDNNGEEILEDRYEKYYKPRGVLLIGRRESAKPKHLRRLLSYFHRIEVLTYDDLIERARNSLTSLLEQKDEKP